MLSKTVSAISRSSFLMFVYPNDLEDNMLISQLKKMSFTCRSLVTREPSLWLFHQPYIWWAKVKRSRVSHARECVIHSKTDLVIDGFQGSANSFATHAFRAAQTNSVELAHHLHSPVQIIAAANRNIPILLTIREPENAVISLIRRWPYISVEQGLQGYIKFYHKLQPYREKMVISTFESTTKRLDEVIQLVNQKFNTEFDQVDVSKASQNRLEGNKQRKQSKEEIDAMRNLKREEMALPSNQILLEKANEAYLGFLEI